MWRTLTVHWTIRWRICWVCRRSVGLWGLVLWELDLLRGWLRSMLVLQSVRGRIGFAPTACLLSFELSDTRLSFCEFCFQLFQLRHGVSERISLLVWCWNALMASCLMGGLRHRLAGLIRRTIGVDTWPRFLSAGLACWPHSITLT